MDSTSLIGEEQNVKWEEGVRSSDRLGTAATTAGRADTGSPFTATGGMGGEITHTKQRPAQTGRPLLCRKVCILVGGFQDQRWTRPEPSPPARAVTSATET